MSGPWDGKKPGRPRDLKTREHWVKLGSEGRTLPLYTTCGGCGKLTFYFAFVNTRRGIKPLCEKCQKLLLQLEVMWEMMIDG